MSREVSQEVKQLHTKCQVLRSNAKKYIFIIYELLNSTYFRQCIFICSILDYVSSFYSNFHFKIACWTKMSDRTFVSCITGDRSDPRIKKANVTYAYFSSLPQDMMQKPPIKLLSFALFVWKVWVQSLS
jgi:hypothetical protein